MGSEGIVEFNWNDAESVVFKTTAGVAVYTNTQGDVVIRQANLIDRNDDDMVILPRDRVASLISALQKEVRPPNEVFSRRPGPSSSPYSD